MFGKITQTKGFWHNGRSLNTYLLVYCILGNINMLVDNVVYSLQPSDILIIPVDTFYKPLQSDGCTHYFFHFFAECLKESHLKPSLTKLAQKPDGKGFSYTYTSSFDGIIDVDILTKHCNNAYVYSVFERAVDLTPYCNATEKLLIDTLIQELLIVLSKDFVHRELSNSKLQDMVDYINVNYAQPITLSLLAKTFFLSESYIARLFRAELHLSVSDYVNSVRLKNACSLLAHTDLSICDIAESVGYGSAYYFSRIFKKVYQVSPSAFRQGQSLFLH